MIELAPDLAVGRQCIPHDRFAHDGVIVVIERDRLTSYFYFCRIPEIVLEDEKTAGRQELGCRLLILRRVSLEMSKGLIRQPLELQEVEEIGTDLKWGRTPETGPHQTKTTRYIELLHHGLLHSAARPS